MITITWCLTISFMLIGLAGTVVPLLPGPAIILAAAVFHHLMLGAQSGIGWPTLLALTALALLSMVVDLISGALGARYFGATRWGAIGGIIGGLVGIFFGVIGIFVGPLAGVLLGELLGGKGVLPAGYATWGSFLGTTAGFIAKFAISISMIAWFLLAALG